MKKKKGGEGAEKETVKKKKGGEGAKKEIPKGQAAKVEEGKFNS